MAAQLTFEDAKGGMNAYDPPNKIRTNQLARMVNCEIVDGLPTTRMGARVVPLSGSFSDFVKEAPFQGSIYYNPAMGQGGIELAAANATLAAGLGGRKILVNINGRKGRAEAVARDISGGIYSNAQNHLVWISQWEDLLIVTDGESRTFIYSPTGGASVSLGYNTVEKLKSEIPNGATVLAYAHARGIAVVNSRQVIVGDNLHRTNLTSSANLRQFTEQAHWASGQYFTPPTAMSGINAAAVLPLKNTNNGQGDVIFHCVNGGFSVRLNVYPRSKWAETEMVQIAFTSGGATGPYALAITVGDQIFRTADGVQTYRSAAATSEPEGNPLQTLSPEVQTWLAADYPRWLRFASVNVWGKQRKSFFTTGPIVRGSRRWHRGIISRNTDVSLTTANTPAVWEGLWTMPPQMRGVMQLVNGIFDREERQFAWVRGDDDQNRLVEFSPTFREDILEDGTAHPIRAQAITRAIDAGKWWLAREYQEARLYLRNLSGEVKWGVWFRPLESPSWQFLNAGSVTVPDFSDDPFDLSASEPQAIDIPLGKIPDTCRPDSKKKSNESRSVQFLVRWSGYCSFEGIRVTHGEQEVVATDVVDTSKLKVTFAKSTGDGYSDFEYSETDDATWINL